MAPRPREHIARLTPYEWEAMAGDVAAAAGIPESEVIRFDTNTAPWPPVAWEQTVLDLPRLPANEYPHPSNEPLRSSLARRFELPPEQVVVTCGADEALFLLASVYLGPGRVAVTSNPYFSMFRVVTESVGGELRTVPVDDAWNLPLHRLLEAAADPSVRVVWLCSPNNPTGLSLDDTFVRTVLRTLPDTLVVLDEAYAEISGESLASTMLQADNGVLVRTFSKGYGLAGARVGYLIGPPEIVRTVETVRLPQNMTAFGIAAAERALKDEAGLRDRVAQIVAERQRLVVELERRGWELLPSKANFVLGRPPQQAVDLAAWLQGAGLIVRSYAGHPRLNAWLRIAVRAPEEDDRLLRRLDAVR